MCPFAMAQALFASFFFGEISSLLAEEEPFDGQTWAVVWLTGLIACLLNIASFLVNVHTSALTLTIAGNVKQAVVIFLSCFIFATPMSPTNLLGITVVVCGGAFYSYVGHREKLLQKKNDYKRVPTTERPMSLCLAV